jgi:hypothetical protein
MKSAKLLLVVALAVGGVNLAVAQEPAPVAHPEQLGFSTPRLQRLTQAFKAMSIAASSRGRSS